MLFPHEHWISPEEYLEIDRASDLKYEYDSGHIYALAGGMQAHARIAYNMANLLDTHLTNIPCRFFLSDVRVQVAEEKYYYPDVTVTCSLEDIDDSLIGSLAATRSSYQSFTITSSVSGKKILS